MSNVLIPYIDIHTHNLEVQSDICSIQSISPEEQITDNGEAMYSVGIHPWKIQQINFSSAIKKLKQIALQNKIVAIGEAGLDRAIRTPLNVQKEIFIEQIGIAEKLWKPLIIHCVKSYSELIGIRKKSKLELPWIFHGFQKNQLIADELVELGCYLSFGKGLLSNEKLQILFCSLPINKLFLETDDSAVCIKDLYKTAAEIKGISEEKLREEFYKNYKTCFNKI